jgi:hypothetical protein
MKILNSGFSKPDKQGWIILGVITLGLIFLLLIKPNSEAKNSCLNSVNYVPPSSSSFGSPEGYYTTWNKKFEARDDAMKYCVKMVKELATKCHILA